MTTIVFVKLTFFIDSPLKGEISNLGPLIILSILLFFTAHEVSA